MINFEILSDRSTISISGGEALKFLQNYTTNDLDKHKYSYNYMLNNQGRYLFDFFVYKDSSSSDQNIFYIDIARDRAESFIRQLSMYKLRADVKIEDISSEFDLFYIRVFWKLAAEVELSGKEYCLEYLESISKDFLYYAQDPRFSGLGYRVVARKGYEFDNGKLELSKNLYLSDKYDYVIIDGVSDLRVEKSIPIEFAGEELNAISFTKGCYIGQEVISRAKHQGVVRKKIYKVKGDILNFLSYSGGEQKLDLLNQDGAKIGSLLSWHAGIGIAQIREENFLKLDNQEYF